MQPRTTNTKEKKKSTASWAYSLGLLLVSTHWSVPLVTVNALSVSQSSPNIRPAQVSSNFETKTNIWTPSPLPIFRQYTDRRLEQADAVPIVDTQGDDDDTVFVELMDMFQMAFAESTSPEMQQKRHDFCQQLRHNGGYCVVRMDGMGVASMDNMWNSMDNLFQNPDNDLLRGFTLIDKANNDTKDGESGYKHVQTQLLYNQIVPKGLESVIGTEGTNHIQEAFLLLAQLATAFSTVVYSGSATIDPAQASKVINNLLHEDNPHRHFAGAYHRLCQYVPAGGDHRNQEQLQNRPLLRSHCDWTLATPIPVSSISGLEVFNVQANQWKRIEDIVARKIAREELQQVSKSTCRRWNARYVVVMIGSWLELLTQGDLSAAMHRVQSHPTIRHQQRLSAPFFLRPKESVFTQTADAFDNNIITGTTSILQNCCDDNDEEEAQVQVPSSMRAIGRFLAELQ
jgi:hypothetical protein